MYLPMELVQKTGEDLVSISELRGFGATNLSEYSRVWLPEEAREYFADDEKYLRFLMGDAFIARDITGTEFENDKEIIDAANMVFVEKAPMLVKVLDVDIRDIRSNRVNIVSEYRDITVFPLVLDMWAHHKQVYKPDPDFAKALMTTEKLELTRSMLEHLPFNVFYIDVDNAGLGDIKGIFVKVVVGRDDSAVVIYNITEDLVYFSHYIHAKFDSEGKSVFDKSSIPNVKPYVLSAVRKLGGEHQEEYNFSRQDTVGLVMQLLVYISSKEPQIEESLRTRSTYKPSKFGDTVKNKWSEVQMFEVGYAYGNAFRKKLRKASEAVDGARIEILTEKEEKRHHNSPKPHIRCAHWHRWRCGEGHKELTPPRWVEPTFVGFGLEADDSPIATVHRIKGKKK